jgi:hypothetical protein
VIIIYHSPRASVNTQKSEQGEQQPKEGAELEQELEVRAEMIETKVSGTASLNYNSSWDSGTRSHVFR